VSDFGGIKATSNKLLNQRSKLKIKDGDDGRRHWQPVAPKAEIWPITNRQPHLEPAIGSRKEWERVFSHESNKSGGKVLQTFF
jgi:hypothetical protein